MKVSGAKRGQTMVEYVLVFVSLLGLFFVLWNHFIPAVQKSTDRTARIVTSDYP